MNKQRYWVTFSVDVEVFEAHVPKSPLSPEILAYWGKGNLVRAVVELEIENGSGVNVRRIIEREWYAFTGLKSVASVSDDFVPIRSGLKITIEQQERLGVAVQPAFPCNAKATGHDADFIAIPGESSRHYTLINPTSGSLAHSVNVSRTSVTLGDPVDIYLYTVTLNTTEFESEEPAVWVEGKDIAVYKSGIVPKLISCIDNVAYEDSSEEAVRELLTTHLNSEEEATAAVLFAL